MKLAVLQENFKAALAAVMPSVATKASMLVLETIKLTADETGLRLTATNLETTIVARCGAKVEEPGSTCVPAKLLNELVAGFPNDRLTMSLTGDTLRFCIARYETTLKTMDADEFPITPAITRRAEMPLPILRNAAVQVAPMAAKEDGRPVLMGVRLRLNGVAQLESADGFRATQLEHALEGSVDPAIDVIIPAKCLLAAAKAFKALKDGKDDLLLQIGTSPASADALGGQPAQLLFDSGDVQVITRLIDGEFPDVAKVFPKAHTCRIVVDQRELLQAVDVASIYAARSSGVLKLEANGPEGDLGYGRLTLSANANSVGDSVVFLDAQIIGSGKIAINAAFLADALNAITTPQIAIELQAPQNPAVLRPVGIDGYIHVIMPMTVR